MSKKGKKIQVVDEPKEVKVQDKAEKQPVVLDINNPEHGNLTDAERQAL